MKRNMIIAAALTIAGVATYMLRKKVNNSNGENALSSAPRTNHITNAFSKAKQHAMSV